MAKNTKKFYLQQESHLQNGIYLLVFVLVALLCLPLAPKPNTVASGILLPQGNSFPAISPSQVEVSNIPPKGATLVGQINTKIHYDSTSFNSDDDNLKLDLNKAKELAAAQGANVIVVNNIGRTILDGPLDGFVVYAEAYHD